MVFDIFICNKRIICIDMEISFSHSTASQTAHPVIIGSSSVFYEKK